MRKFNQDLVFCRAPEEKILTSSVREKQVEKIDPLLDWLESEFGFKPVVYMSFFGGKQDDGLVKAIEDLLKKTDDCELAAIDAIAAAAHSLVIAVGMFCGKLQIEEAIELIRLKEDLQVDKWGLVERGHDGFKYHQLPYSLVFQESYNLCILAFFAFSKFVFNSYF